MKLKVRKSKCLTHKHLEVVRDYGRRVISPCPHRAMKLERKHSPFETIAVTSSFPGQLDNETGLRGISAKKNIDA